MLDDFMAHKAKSHPDKKYILEVLGGGP